MKDKLTGFIEGHPKLMLALCGAALALQVFELAEVSRTLAAAFREAHRAEIASDAARAASEALGG